MNYDAYLRKKLELNPDLNRECCRDVNNLRYAFDENKFKDALVLKCKHCGKLHHQGKPIPRYGWDRLRPVCAGLSRGHFPQQLRALGIHPAGVRGLRHSRGDQRP